MNEPDVSYEPVWRHPLWARPWRYLYAIAGVDYYEWQGQCRAKYGAGPTFWTEICEKGHALYGEDWNSAPQSARDHLTALAALHR